MNNEGKDIRDLYEQRQWRSVRNRQRQIKRLQQYARNTLQKTKD